MSTRSLMHIPGQIEFTDFAMVPRACDPICTYMVDLLATNKLFVVIPKSVPLAERQIKHGQITYESPHGTIMIDGYLLDMFDSKIFYTLVALAWRNGSNPSIDVEWVTFYDAMGRSRGKGLRQRILDGLYRMSKTTCSLWDKKGRFVGADARSALIWNAYDTGKRLRVTVNPIYITNYTGHYITLNNHLRREFKSQYGMGLYDFFKDQGSFRKGEWVEWEENYLIELCRGYYGALHPATERVLHRSFVSSVKELKEKGFFDPESYVGEKGGNHWLFCRKGPAEQAGKRKEKGLKPRPTAPNGTDAQATKILHERWLAAGLPFGGSGKEWGQLRTAAAGLEALFNKLVHGPRYSIYQLIDQAVSFVMQQATEKGSTATTDWLGTQTIEVHLRAYLKEAKGMEFSDESTGYRYAHLRGV